MGSKIDIKEPIVFTLKDIAKVKKVHQAKGFNIPIYQRLYDWKSKEIEKLLSDFNQSFLSDKERDYYLGNLTLYYNDADGSKRFDIIDGQQRLTTLWLIGLVFKVYYNQTRWNDFLKDSDGISLSFVAREKDNEYLEWLLQQTNKNDVEKAVNDSVNGYMLEAIVVINNFLDKNNDILTAFSDYILDKVKMAAIFLPDTIDLNKYFEDMNNRGLQLESHHIVKAWMLEKIDKDLNDSYARVWDSVAQLNQYVEYGLQGTLKENRKKIFENDWNSFFVNQPSVDNPENTLQGIIKRAEVEKYTSGVTKVAEEEKDRLTSIIKFPEFLLHVLTLYVERYMSEVSLKISLDENKLNSTFEEILKYASFNSEEYVEFLFKCRILFDQFIVKSINTNEGFRWEIKGIKGKSVEDEFERSKDMEDQTILQIQSMLNASTSLSLWLTDTLKYLLDNFDMNSHFSMNESAFLEKLEAIDNSLHPVVDKEINLNNGVRTDRYWFFKLDYLLWKKWVNDDTFQLHIIGLSNLHYKIKSFQFRDNRSVEHIYPQNPETETWQDDNLIELKDSFGNLALISVSSNSSYNNQTPDEKKKDFIHKSEKRGIESLKLVDIYSTDWTIANMQAHEDRMLKILGINQNSPESSDIQQ